MVFITPGSYLIIIGAVKDRPDFSYALFDAIFVILDAKAGPF